MNELTQQSILSLISSKESEILTHTKQAYIFRSSVTYISQIIQTFLHAVRSSMNNNMSATKVQALRQIYDMISHYDSILPHLSIDKWIQPALNWPASYLFEYIKGLRENLVNITPSLGLVANEVLRFDSQQDNVNQTADLKALKDSIQSLSLQVSINDAVGVQRQIETKLNEINKLLPRKSLRRATFDRRPSAENQPIIQMKHRIQELLSQFKSINIEIDDLSLEGQIGAGGFGTVFKATRLSTAEIVAVKELRSNRLTMSSWASLYAEVETMCGVRHPYVLELVGAHITDPYRIITRYCPNKSLFERLHRPTSEYGKLSPTRLTIIAYQVAVGMAHLHSLSIVHRDLKTLNILLDKADDGCVADFGLSGMMKDNQELCGGVGTPHYTAPEVLAHSRYGPKVDIFSYAVVLWEMLMRTVPYGEMSHLEIYEHVVTRGWRLPIPHDTPEGLKKLITRCWSKSPNDRPEFSEIVSLFEKGEVHFPKSDSFIDFEKIKKVRRCPLLNFDYLKGVLKNSADCHFSSIVYYICARGDEDLREKLRREKILELMTKTPSENIDAVLVYASFILNDDEFADFLRNGGLSMYKLCVNTSNVQAMSAAIRFGLRIPKSELNQLKIFLSKIVQFLQGNTVVSPHILQFLTRFDSEELTEFKSQIAASIMDVVTKVEDQSTFDAIATLLPLIKDSLTMNQMRLFYTLLTCDFVVPSSFVSILIDSPDNWSHAPLILSILKAMSKSDIDEVFLSFLQKCAKNERGVFMQLYQMNDFFETIQSLLEKVTIQMSPLFLLFCIAPIEDAALKLANHPMLSSLINMKGFQIQRLQIFTSLCFHEKFCTSTKYIEGIIHILVNSISVKTLTKYAVNLICAFSSHPDGCRLLNDNGVLELFTQFFLSTNNENTEASHVILRNFARNNRKQSTMPQGSMIISCLMQDMIYDVDKRIDILETIVTLVKTMPGCVQEHDLLKIILPLLIVQQGNHALMKLALKLFAIVEPVILRNIYPQLLSQIYKILSSPKLMFPEIIEECLKVVISIEENFDILVFLQKTQLQRFLQDVIKLLPVEDPHVVTFDNYLKKLNQISSLNVQKIEL